MARTCVSKDAQSRCKGPSPPRSVALEAALQFPVGDPTIVLELLPAGSVQVMLHDLVAKGRAQHLRLLQRLDRLAQGLRHVVQLLAARSEEHTSELQSLMRIPYAVFSLKKK